MRVPVCSLVVACILASPAAAQTRSNSGLPDAAALAGFGADVLVDGGTVLVGRTGLSAMFPEPPTQLGGVHGYDFVDGAWIERFVLRPVGLAMGDDLGRALAVSGDVLLVGAPGADSGRGKVIVFRRAAGGKGWDEAAALALPDARPGDRFGSAVAFGGAVALVAAPGRREVQAFARRGPSWEATGILAIPGDTTGVFPGSLAYDGGTAVVGQRLDTAGRVHVFHWRGGGWHTGASITAPEGAVRFGAAVALRGSDLVVGASGGPGWRVPGSVVHYRLTGGAWTLAQTILPPDTTTAEQGPSNGWAFGMAVALDGDELWIAAGVGGGGEPTGSVQVYRRSGGGGGEWRHVQELWEGGYQRGAASGGRLALAGDLGVRTLPIMDFGEGRAVAYRRGADGRWGSTGSLIDGGNGLTTIAGGTVPCQDGKAGEFSCNEMELLAFLPVSAVGGERGDIVNDLWGWTDPESKREFVLIGRSRGTAFVEITNPSSPVYLGSLPAHEGSTPNAWRDVKTYKHYALIVADNVGKHGMQVFDLRQLRNVTAPPATFTETAHYDGLFSSHNLVVNEESGFAFAVGSSGGGETCGGQLHMIDVRDPLHPAFAGCFNDQKARGTHDAQCVTYHGPDQDYTGRELCLGSNGSLLSISDVTDKAHPVSVSTIAYPNLAYTHQGWFTDDQAYFYVNDEGDEVSGLVDRTRTLIFDLRDLDDPVVAGEYFGETRASDHNLYVVGDRMYESNYVSGLRVIDISDRTKPKEIGYFDTVPWGENAPGFAGSWSNYPFFPSGTVAVSSIKEGLFLIKRREAPVP